MVKEFIEDIGSHIKDAENTLYGSNTLVLGIGLDNDDLGQAYISDLFLTGPAHKAGIMAGDSVVKINGLDVSARRALDIARTIAQAANPVRITVKRDGREIPFSVMKAPMPFPQDMIQRCTAKLEMASRLLQAYKDKAGYPLVDSSKVSDREFPYLLISPALSEVAEEMYMARPKKIFIK